VDDAVVRSLLDSEDAGFERRLQFASQLGLDAVCLQPRLSTDAVGGGLPMAKDVDWPDLRRWVWDSDRFVFAMMDGAFGWGSRLLGLEGILLTAARSALQLLELVRSVEALNLDLIQRAAASGAMGLVIADDIAYQRGLFFPPAILRSLFFPSLAKQVAAAHRAGLPVFFHCDGDVTTVLDDLVETGLDGLHGIESAAGMDLRGIRERCGSRLCLWGNLDPRYLVQPQSHEQLRDAVRSIVSVADPEGGLIFGTSSGLFAGMSSENLRAVYSLAREA
jgi:uroporphyrinogen decarboxylase